VLVSTYLWMRLKLIVCGCLDGNLQAALHLPEPAAAAVTASGAGVAAAPRLGGGMWSHLPAVAQSGVRGRVAVLWTGERFP
jgi:hypothetical protein